MKKVLLILSVLAALSFAPFALADDVAVEGMLDQGLETVALESEEVTVDESGLPTLAFGEAGDLQFVSSNACTDLCEHYYAICMDKCGPNPSYYCSRQCDLEAIACYGACY